MRSVDMFSLDEGLAATRESSPNFFKEGRLIVTPIAHGLDLLKSDLVRSPGLHASDIYGSLFKGLDPKRYDYGEDDDLNAELMALGSAWEDRFEKILLLNGVQATRPGELRSPEGIYYSPDLIIFNSHTRVGEIKLTSMAVDDMPTEITNELQPKFDKYLCQLKLYAYWLELLHGWLGVLSIRKPYAPVLKAFELEWTERELQENHQMCMNHARSEGMLQ